MLMCIGIQYDTLLSPGMSDMSHMEALKMSCNLDLVHLLHALQMFLLYTLGCHAYTQALANFRLKVL